ncbi:PREDICTED: uncharacterized protein LOC18612477 [Theobroma cacao]|uniref:Uncharacterized protein LOC18612477 n=1 Tax=Theobroma cacao TaxID=3641 RepID=A0AB32VQH8_THECC|nr:PREDICTED: uncharacterized protein LOC18612477 [Theobroma cacao]
MLLSYNLISNPLSLRLLKLFKSLSQTFSIAKEHKVSMETRKQQGTQAPIQLISSFYFLKLVAKILVPLSVLSVILSYPLLCNFHILAYGLQLFNFSIGKNYMFLLCNGLLVFIATSSGLIRSSSVKTDSKAEKTIKRKGCSQREQLESSEKKGSIEKAKVTIEVDLEARESQMDSLALVQGTEDVPVVVQDEGEEQSSELIVVEEDEDEGLGLMSKEELNKKCEEFIRKMKEGIQFEARQLIMVQ